MKSKTQKIAKKPHTQSQTKKIKHPIKKIPSQILRRVRTFLTSYLRYLFFGYFLQTIVQIFTINHAQLVREAQQERNDRRDRAQALPNLPKQHIETLKAQMQKKNLEISARQRIVSYYECASQRGIPYNRLLSQSKPLTITRALQPYMIDRASCQITVKTLSSIGSEVDVCLEFGEKYQSDLLQGIPLTDSYKEDFDRCVKLSKSALEKSEQETIQVQISDLKTYLGTELFGKKHTLQTFAKWFQNSPFKTFGEISKTLWDKTNSQDKDNEVTIQQAHIDEISEELSAHIQTKVNQFIQKKRSLDKLFNELMLEKSQNLKKQSAEIQSKFDNFANATNTRDSDLKRKLKYQKISHLYTQVTFFYQQLIEHPKRDREKLQRCQQIFRSCVLQNKQSDQLSDKEIDECYHSLKSIFNLLEDTFTPLYDEQSPCIEYYNLRATLHELERDFKETSISDKISTAILGIFKTDRAHQFQLIEQILRDLKKIKPFKDQRDELACSIKTYYHLLQNMRADKIALKILENLNNSQSLMVSVYSKKEVFSLTHPQNIPVIQNPFFLLACKQQTSLEPWQEALLREYTKIPEKELLHILNRAKWKKRGLDFYLKWFHDGVDENATDRWYHDLLYSRTEYALAANLHKKVFSTSPSSIADLIDDLSKATQDDQFILEREACNYWEELVMVKQKPRNTALSDKDILLLQLFLKRYYQKERSIKLENLSDTGPQLNFYRTAFGLFCNGLWNPFGIVPNMMKIGSDITKKQLTNILPEDVILNLMCHNLLPRRDERGRPQSLSVALSRRYVPRLIYPFFTQIPQLIQASFICEIFSSLPVARHLFGIGTASVGVYLKEDYLQKKPRPFAVNLLLGSTAMQERTQLIAERLAPTFKPVCRRLLCS